MATRKRKHDGAVKETGNLRELAALLVSAILASEAQRAGEIEMQMETLREVKGKRSCQC
jgi:hypothetical protein